jgi:hypothetical protein
MLGMYLDDDRPLDPSLQPPTHPSFRKGNKSKNRHDKAARVRSRDDDDSDSSPAHSLEKGHTSATCGRGTARQDSASQQPDSSKEWMFQGIVAVPNLSEVDWDDNDGVPDEVREGFPEVGEELKASFSINAPAEIEYIVIVSDIEKVSCEVYQNEKMLGVPVRGYVATSRRVYRKEWEDSIRWCSTELEHLTWTKISGGIRCWDQFKYDRDDVNDPESTVGVLAMWGTRSYEPWNKHCGR